METGFTNKLSFKNFIMKNNNLSTNRENDNEALTPAELIKKHNANSKHIISDNEMKNLKVAGILFSPPHILHKKYTGISASSQKK